MSIPRAQLRVFSPVNAFPPREREHWQSYVADGHGVSRTRLAQFEHASRRYMYATKRLPTAKPEALTRRVGRRVLVCPIDLELRAAGGYALVSDAFPPIVKPVLFADDTEAKRCQQLTNSGRVPHILDAAWAPPLVWFMAFQPSERRFFAPAEGSEARVVFVTTVSQALERIEQVHAVIESAEENTGFTDSHGLIDDIHDFIAWLERFDATAVVEFDYGDRNGFATSDELRDDTTCTELWEMVEALADNDEIKAEFSYARARSRWERQHTRAFAS
jgi:hypothetical protein